jgi:hypothetical protein
MSLRNELIMNQVDQVFIMGKSVNENIEPILDLCRTAYTNFNIIKERLEQCESIESILSSNELQGTLTSISKLKIMQNMYHAWYVNFCKEYEQLILACGQQQHDAVTVDTIKIISELYSLIAQKTNSTYKLIDMLENEFIPDFWQRFTDLQELQKRKEAGRFSQPLPKLSQNGKMIKCVRFQGVPEDSISKTIELNTRKIKLVGLT